MCHKYLQCYLPASPAENSCQTQHTHTHTGLPTPHISTADNTWRQYLQSQCKYLATWSKLNTKAVRANTNQKRFWLKFLFFNSWHSFSKRTLHWHNVKAILRDHYTIKISTLKFIKSKLLSGKLKKRTLKAEDLVYQSWTMLVRHVWTTALTTSCMSTHARTHTFNGSAHARNKIKNHSAAQQKASP